MKWYLSTIDFDFFQSTANLEGNKLDIVQKGEYNSLISRVFDGNSMTLKIKIDGR
jgi:hypothetical protein